MSVREAALAYAARGWRVLPVHSIRDGRCTCRHPGCLSPGKHPIETGWQHRATTSGADIWEWWERWPYANVGIATGFESGIFVPDIDPEKGGDATLAALIAEHGPLPATRTHRTGSGGTHYVFIHPDFAVISKTGTFGTGIDTRGAGGFIVAPPSVSGKGAYTVIDDRDPVAAPEWLLAPLRDLASRVAGGGDVPTVTGEPVDQADIPDRLAEMLKVMLSDGQGRYRHFYRIVAEARRAGYRQGQIVTLAAPWCAMTGKFTGRVEAQVATVWGKLDAEIRGIQFSPDGQPERPATSQVSDSEAWDTPVPLGAVPVLPAFPAGIFPPWLRQEVTCLTEFAQVPVDLPAVITLAVLAAAAGGRAVVEIRGSWREPLNLYALTAMLPGSRKSAVFAELTQPLLDTEQTLIEKTGPQITEAVTQRKIAQRDAEKAAAKASGLDGEARDRAMAEAIGAAQLAEAVTVPVMPKLVADDVTPEAAASLLAEQGGRLAILSAEGGCFSTLSGRYSAAPNLEVFLKGHSGDMLRVDRKGRPPEHIPHPALTLGLAVQPQVLRDIAAMPGFRGRGLLARLLYSIPPNTVGARKIRTDPIPEDIRDTYTASIRALVLTLAEWDDPAVLMLTPEAAELLLTTAEELEPRLGPDGDLGHIADWASKLIGATARIAGLLHLAANLQDGWGKPISHDTMTAAVQAAGYFTAHALAAFDGMGADPVFEDARHVLGWIARQDEKFAKRELFRAEQSRFRKIADLDPVLAILEQHGYIRLTEQPERSGPGRRPSPEYAIHPGLDESTVRC